MFMTRPAPLTRDMPTGEVRTESLRTALIGIVAAGPHPNGDKPEQVGGNILASGLPSASVCGYLTANRAPVGRSNGKCRLNPLFRILRRDLGYATHFA